MFTYYLAQYLLVGGYVIPEDLLERTRAYYDDDE